MKQVEIIEVHSFGWFMQKFEDTTTIEDTHSHTHTIELILFDAWAAWRNEMINIIFTISVVLCLCEMWVVSAIGILFYNYMRRFIWFCKFHFLRRMRMREEEVCRWFFHWISQFKVHHTCKPLLRRLISISRRRNFYSITNAIIHSIDADELMRVNNIWNIELHVGR